MLFVEFRNLLFFYDEWVLAPCPLEDRDYSAVLSDSQYLVGVPFTIHNLRKWHAIVTRKPLNIITALSCLGQVSSPMLDIHRLYRRSAVGHVKLEHATNVTLNDLTR
jgi:hypothetical protein